MTGRPKKTFLDKQDIDVKIRIDNVKGQNPKYDGWAVDGTGWVVVDGEKTFEKTISLNVLKKNSCFEEREDSDCPLIIQKMKKKYASELEEDREFTEYFDQSLEKEKSRVEEVQGQEFEV